MFEPNCVVVVPFSEIAIKGDQTRAFFEKRLRKNITDYLDHFEVPISGIDLHAGRMVIHSPAPQKVISSLTTCFGINLLFLAQQIEFTTLEDLCKKSAIASKGSFDEGTFAVRGKSFTKEFSSKKLEEEIGGTLLDAYPKLKVKLKNPEKEFYCLTIKQKAYFYFEPVLGMKGMPVGTQGRAALLVTKDSKEKDLILLGKSLLKVGCSVAIVSDEIKIPDLSELSKFTSFKEFKINTLEYAKSGYGTDNLRAFFSTARTKEQAKKDSELVGVKVFAPLLF